MHEFALIELSQPSTILSISRTLVRLRCEAFIKSTRSRVNNVPTFPAEISLYSNVDLGLRVDCPEKLLPGVTAVLSDAGFKRDAATVEVPATANISNWSAVRVEGSDIAGAQAALKTWLASTGTAVAEEVHMSPGEKHVKYNLLALGVFDKQA